PGRQGARGPGGRERLRRQVELRPVEPSRDHPEAGLIRVLLVEDYVVTRESLSHLLQEDPEIEVAGTARDGIEAVEQAQRLKPDLVLMDVHMPRMNGYDATRQIME